MTVLNRLVLWGVPLFSVMAALVLFYADSRGSESASASAATHRVHLTLPAHSEPMLGAQLAVGLDSETTRQTIPQLEVRPTNPVSVGDIDPPVRLHIDQLGLDLPITPVGVDDSGLLDVPAAEQVGWYRHGPVPGASGSAVLAAHVDLAGRAGAFFELDQLEPGDVVRLDFEAEPSRFFVVADQTLYDKASFPAATLFRRQGLPVLTLVTCGGTFDEVRRTYRGNRVVTAVPVINQATGW